MIISASYKTDIPTFYGEWFMNRLRAGYCKTINPWNRTQISRVSLDVRDVDGIIFWTKNIGPFLPHLEEIHDRGYPFVIQHTVNAFPRAIEFSVVDSARSVQHLQGIAKEYGARVCVWRYDTIVISSLTPPDFHRENFSRLCLALAGATDEVVVSFVQLYQKTLRNMNWAAAKFGFSWRDPPLDEKRALLMDLSSIARANGMQLTVCTQPDLVVPDSVESRCIDAGRLEDIAGRQVRAKQRGARKDCGCFASRDIGEYDTCPHGCVYCYAVQNRELAQRRFREHDPNSEFLFSIGNAVNEAPRPDTQKTLFDELL